MIAWTQRHPRIRKAIAVTALLGFVAGVFYVVPVGKSVVYMALSYAAACTGDLHHDIVWSDQSTGFSNAIEPMLVAAADRVPLDAAREIALAKCSIGTPQSRAHLQRAIGIAPMNSYVLLQAAFADLPVAPGVALALVRRDPSDFVALTVARLLTFRAGDDINSNPVLVRGLIRYQLVANPTLAQTRFVDALYYISKEHEAEIALRHGTKQRELAAYRAAARDIIASAPPHLDPQILAFAERGTLPQPSTRQTRPIK